MFERYLVTTVWLVGWTSDMEAVDCRFDLLQTYSGVEDLSFKEGAIKYPSRVAAGEGFLATFELVLEFELLEFEL